MTVKIVELDKPYDYAPMVKNKQFFSTIKDGKVTSTFLVNHDKFQTATQYLQKNPEGAWDFVRTATVDEVIALA